MYSLFSYFPAATSSTNKRRRLSVEVLFIIINVMDHHCKNIVCKFLGGIFNLFMNKLFLSALFVMNTFHIYSQELEAATLATNTRVADVLEKQNEFLERICLVLEVAHGVISVEP